jgi:hypothetical protein
VCGPGVQYKHYPFGAPEDSSPYGFTVLTSYGGDHWPRVAVDHDGRVRVTFARKKLNDDDPETPGVYEMVSDDVGATWSQPSMIFDKGDFPTLAMGVSGTMMYGVWVADTDGDGTEQDIGVIQIAVQNPGDPAPNYDADTGGSGTPYTATDKDGNQIKFYRGGFHFAQAHEDATRWVLAALQASAAAFGHWVSGDDGQTWELLDQT